MSKYEKQIADYQTQNRNMFLVFTALMTVVVLNAAAVMTGAADGYYAEVHNWISTSL